MIADKTILLVDDVDFFRDLMKRYLQKTPVQALTADSGRTAIEMALEHTPDVICMDVAMPEVNGVQACREIKAHPKLQNIPVILLYNPDNVVESELISDAPCNDTLTKPLLREEFLTLTHRHLFHLERRERRVACQMTVECAIDGKIIQGRGVDISRSGLYIEYRGEVPPGNRAEISFYLASVSPQKLSFPANVAWINQGHPRPNLSLPQGLGVAFDVIPGDMMTILDRFIADN